MPNLVTPAEAKKILEQVKIIANVPRPFGEVDKNELYYLATSEASRLTETVIALWPFLQRAASEECIYGQGRCGWVDCLPCRARELLETKE